MTSPPSLGGVSQIPVTTRPTQALPGLGSGLVTLYNSDLTNLVYVSYTQWFTPGLGDSVPIQPLANATLDASRPIYVASLVAGVAPLLVAPGGTQLQPSPAQVAQQIGALGLATASNQVTQLSAINAPAYGPATLSQQVTQQTAIPNNIAATGVPGLVKSSATGNVTGQTIAAGATLHMGPFTSAFTQPSYALFLNGQANGSATSPFLSATLVWSDHGTGQIVHCDQWTTPLTSTAGGGLLTAGYGPTQADTLDIYLTNTDTLAMTNVSAYLFQSSRYYTDDIWANHWDPTVFSNMPGVPTFQIGSGQRMPTSRILFTINRSLGVNVTTTPSYILPLWSGSVYFTFHGGGSNNWGGNIYNAFTGNILIGWGISSSNNYQAGPFNLGRVPLALNFVNNGSVSGTMNAEVHALNG